LDSIVVDEDGYIDHRVLDDSLMVDGHISIDRRIGLLETMVKRMSNTLCRDGHIEYCVGQTTTTTTTLPTTTTTSAPTTTTTTLYVEVDPDFNAWSIEQNESYINATCQNLIDAIPTTTTTTTTAPPTTTTTLYVEVDPQVDLVTSGRFCKGTGSVVNCTDASVYLTTETDSAHDTCAEITGCVENAITDGNTGWTNEYGLLTAEVDGSTTNEIQNVQTGKGLQRDGSNNFGLIACGNNQILKNVTGTWTCANDEGGAGDIEGVTAGNGLTGGGTSGTVTVAVGSITGENITSGTVADARVASSITRDSEVPSLETDSAHDTCGEITGCVVGAITDGNTGWTNEYGLLTAEVDGSTTNEIQNVQTNKGLQRDGSNNFGLIACGNNQILKNVSGNWACADDVDTSLSDEQVQDLVGGMVTSNTETGIAVTYEDGDGTLDFVVSESDPQVGTTTAGKWCVANGGGTGIDCATDPPVLTETDSAHDTCGEITGCVVGAITAVPNDFRYTGSSQGATVNATTSMNVNSNTGSIKFNSATVGMFRNTTAIWIQFV
jgi:hypothetical protein